MRKKSDWKRAVRSDWREWTEWFIVEKRNSIHELHENSLARVSLCDTFVFLLICCCCVRFEISFDLSDKFMVNHIHRHHESVKYAKCRWKAPNNNSNSNNTIGTTIEGKPWADSKLMCVWLRQGRARERETSLMANCLVLLLLFSIFYAKYKQKTMCYFFASFVVTLFGAFVVISNSKETHTRTHSNIIKMCLV